MNMNNRMQQDDQATTLEELRQKIGEEYHNAREITLISQQRIERYEKKARICRDHMEVMGSFIDSCNDLKTEAFAGNDVGSVARMLKAKVDRAICQYEIELAY